jgi:hypothetical protein
MPPKKNAKKEDDPVDDTNDGPEEHPRIQIPGHRYDFAHYRNRLADEKRQQRIARRNLPALIRRHVQLLEAGDQDALTEWLRHEGTPVTRAARDVARHRYTILQAWLEDFLYYQTAVHRRRRLKAMKTGRTGNQLVMRRNPGEPKWNSTWAFTHADDKEVRRMLDSFDEMRTGHAGHRTDK